MHYFPMLIHEGQERVKRGSCASIERAVNQIHEVQREVENTASARGEGETFAHTVCQGISARSLDIAAVQICTKAQMRQSAMDASSRGGGLDFVVRSQL